METFSLNIMNTNFYIALSTTRNTSWKQKVNEWLQYVAKEWSRFEENNELFRLNRMPVGEIIKLSPHLYDCLNRANDYYIKTNRRFSPYLKLQLEQHGYNKSFPFKEAELSTRLTEPAELPPIQFLNDFCILKQGNEEIDLGGFAKGYIVEKIAQWLQQEVATDYGIVDGGGDMTMWSKGEKDWIIGISDPNNNQHELSQIKLKNGAIATSNRVYRSWKQGNTTKNHLLNGQTGEVIHSNILQATVVTNSLTDAEVATKLCFLLTDEQLQQWIEEQKIRIACFIVKRNNQSYWLKGGERKDVS